MPKIKGTLITFLVLMLFPVMMLEVHAAGVPYNWIVDGETVDQSNASGTATLTKDGTNIVLTLNNYQGGKLELNCYGTGQSGLNFTIRLIGDNTITVNDGVGIVYNYENSLQFTGDGKLTIQAPQPISSENYATRLYISPSEQIYTDAPLENTSPDSDKITDSTEQEEDKITEDETEKTAETEIETSKSDNNILLYIAIGGYVLLSLIVIVYLMIQNKKKANV